MADDATRAEAYKRLAERKEEKYKKELDRLHQRIRSLEQENSSLREKAWMYDSLCK